MSSILELPLGSNKPTDLVTISVSFAAIYVLYFIISTIYDLYYGPLSKFPGPRSWAISRLPRIRVMVQGNDGKVYPELHEKYGPIVRIGPRDLSVASEGAQGWKDLYGFKKHGAPFPFKDKKEFYGKSLNRVDSIILADDEGHSRQRKVLSHAFSDKALKEQEPLVKRWSELLRKKLSERADGSDHVDMLKMLNCTTFDIMGDLTFSEGLNMLEGSEYSPWVKTIFASIKTGTFLRGIQQIGPTFKYIMEELLFKSKTVRQKQWEHWNYTTERVHRRLAREPEHEDLWSKILKKEKDEGGLKEGEHESNASLFMVAGTETTATALSGTTYYLLKNPAYMKKLVEEIRSAFSDFDDVTFEGLARLKYLQAILQEGLRMYPPVPIALPRRTPQEGAMVCGEFVPGDVSIGVMQFATYRSSKNFTKPYEFRPERWLNDPEFKNDNLNAVEPFSFGPRNCLGKNLAWHEMRTLLVTVLLHFDLQLCEDSDDWANQKIYTLWEKKPLMCTLKPVVKA